MRCTGQGNCTTDVQGCTCNAFQYLSNCSATYCAYNQPAAGLGTCTCNASYTGSHCQTRKCGMYGDATGPGGACQCYGVMRPNPAQGGVCTNHICGQAANRGYPYGSGVWCTCYAGSRLVQSSTVCQCQKPCSSYGTYQIASDSCLCVPGYTGDLCELLIVSKKSVPQDWNVLMVWILTAAIVVVTTVGVIAPHISTNQYH